MPEEPEYMICEYKKIRQEYPEYQKSIKMCHEAVREKAQSAWPGLKISRSMYPIEGEIGETTILPKFLRNRAGSKLSSFRQNFASTGWQYIFYDNANLMDEDICVGIPGFGILSPTLNFDEIRMEIGDKKYARIDLEEAQGYEQPAIIFKEGLVIPEEKSYIIKGKFAATGYQRIVPIQGLCLYKKKDSVISE